MDGTFDMREQTLVLREVGKESFDGSSNHGIFAHQNHTADLSFSSQADSDLVHLLRADIVHSHDEDRLVFLQQALQLVEVSSLVCCLAPHVCFGIQTGCLRVK